VKTDPHLRRLACSLFGALWLAVWAAAQSQPASSAKGNEFEWRFSIKPNQVVSSNITAENTCRRRNRFEVDVRQLPPFVHLPGDSSSMIDSHSRHVFPVKFDSTGLAAGKYEGVIVIKCPTCQQNGCMQDRELLHIYMTVEGGAEAPFVPNRILVVMALDPAESVEARAKKLAAAHGLDIAEIHQLNSINAALIAYSLPQGMDVLKKITELDAEVLMAQPDFVYHTLDGESEEDESLAKLQYGPKLIHADRLAGSVTGKGVRVAVIDTGIDTSHPGLKGKIVEQNDATGKGFTPDIHGTFIAGILASEPRNPTGVSGIAQGAEIVAIKACQPETPQTIQAQCWSLTLAQGVDFAIQKKARAVNFSLGGPREKLLTRLIDEGVNRGITVIAAAGNDGPHGQPSFPAALPNVIAVTAVDANEKLYSQATQGDFIAVAAPGVEIVSTGPGSKLLVASGTSYATAFVTGTAALILEQQPQLSPAALRSLLERTAKDLGPPGKDPQFGSGLVDACVAIAQLRTAAKLCNH